MTWEESIELVGGYRDGEVLQAVGYPRELIFCRPKTPTPADYNAEDPVPKSFELEKIVYRRRPGSTKFDVVR